ncbi:MAG: choice-of-anchor D domain-containing protein, partial [Polyangia bacterium]
MRALATLALLLTACSPGTEVLVRVSATDLAVPADLQRLRISVTNPNATDPTRIVYDSGLLTLCGEGVTAKCFSLPVTVDITPGSTNLATSVRVEVDAFAAASTPVVSEASVFQFVRGQSQRLDFDLVRACLGTGCASQDLACGSMGACALVSPNGGAQPVLAFDQITYDYGAAPVGETLTRVFTLKNNGTKTSGPVAISLSGDPDFSITANDCQGIPLGPPCTVSVTIAPTTTGPKNGTLVASA